MRVAFAGTPAFACPALEAIVAAGHDVPVVLTQPDRPAGRGMRLAATEVALAAGRLGVPVEKPRTLRTPDAVELLRAASPDVLVVAAYGLILPPPVLELPAHGCINIHASLLPRWRGAAPIHRAILAGDAITGISIMRMDAGLDTGPVLLERGQPIGPRDTTGSLTDKLAHLGSKVIVEALAALDSLRACAQDPALATYAPKISGAEAVIDWSKTAEEIDRQVRAFNPSPGAQGVVEGVPLKVWEAEVASLPGAPGRLAGARGSELVVGCGRGSLRLLTIQRPGGRRMAVSDFLRGSPWSQATPS